MNKMIVSVLALGLFAGTASAAQNGYKLSATPKSTARQAALGAAAYTFNRALKTGAYNTRNLHIEKVFDGRGNTQKFKISSDNGARTRTVTVKKVSGGWAGYIPNSNTKVRFGTNHN